MPFCILIRLPLLCSQRYGQILALVSRQVLLLDFLHVLLQHWVVLDLLALDAAVEAAQHGEHVVNLGDLKIM